MSTLSSRAILMIISLALWGLLGCGSERHLKAKSAAEAVYLQGMDALESEDFLTANERFNTLKTKYLFSPFAALAELRLGDSALAQGHTYEAIQTYQTFIQTRPQHAEVPYAYWKIGESYAKDRPSDFFVLPPSFERDRNATKDALRALKKYLELYPQHKNAKEAQALVSSCRRELASHELYVARFYRDRKKWVAARGRYELLLSRFPDTKSLWREGASELVEVYQALKLDDRAKNLENKLKAQESSD